MTLDAYASKGADAFGVCADLGIHGYAQPN